MTIKREAAYHEAAHAVLASISKYHSIVKYINLHKYGAGEIYIALSKNKCAAGGKPQDISALKDKEVAQDFATVICAGLIGEKIASEQDNTLTPNKECAKEDYALMKQQLQHAGLSINSAMYETQARVLLEKHWDTVERLASYLFSNQMASPDQVSTIIIGTSDLV